MSKTKKEHSINVFTDNKLKRYVSPKTYAKYLDYKRNKMPLDFELINKIAQTLKKWAIKKDVTYYTHWFQPLTGKSAGKQVSFLEIKDARVIEEFNVNSLIKGETDASSFPNGGERMTFEARGYTVWDYSSSAVIQDLGNGHKVLLIPTAFFSYKGTALDEKAPLLRSTEVLNTYAVKLLHMLGYLSVNNIVVNVGGEQEYFLIKKSDFLKRKDLILTERTLLGAKPVKSQEKHRNYFGAISKTVSAFMKDVNSELWKMGITAKIQHNEAAPCQHEIVPIYTNVNEFCDQNQLIMETLQNVAEKYDLVVLLHEKPFGGINGSGKHMNWSISTDTGINLFDSSNEDKNLFLLFMSSVISAIDEFASLVRVSASFFGNDLRLGGDEAPPSIISIFVGEVISKIFNDIESGVASSVDAKDVLEFGVNLLPINFKDNCDRNRTSPFAFTGNKFEFRMVGSSQSLSFPNTVLCTILAHKLKEIINNYGENGVLTEVQILDVVKDNISKHKKIIFNGNGYDSAWQNEAVLRGLPVFKNCVESYEILNDDKIINLFKDLNVLKTNELKSRQEILYKNYVETVLTESYCLHDLINGDIIPAFNKVVAFNQNVALNNEKLSMVCEYNNILIEKICTVVNNLHTLDMELINKIDILEEKITEEEKADFISAEVLPIQKKIREIYDENEVLIPTYIRPLPSYNEILYSGLL